MKHTLWIFHRGRMLTTTKYQGHARWCVEEFGKEPDQMLEIWGRATTCKKIRAMYLTNVSDARVEFALGRVLRKFPGYYVASTESQLSIGPPAFVDYGRPELTL